MSGEGGEYITCFRHLLLLKHRPLPYFVDEEVGMIALPFSVERLCFARQTGHLLSNAAEWRTGYTVVDDTQKSAEVAVYH